MDATCAIQNSIHVFSLVHINMCPGFWVHISFTDPEGVLLFTIPDGDCVTLMYGDGETVAGVCRYLDQDHAEINGVRWRMTEFALQMQIRGILFSPAITK